MKITEVAFFAYAVSDMPKARAFYEDVLKLKPNSEYDGSGNANWVEYDIGATTLGIGCAPGMRRMRTRASTICARRSASGRPRR